MWGRQLDTRSAIFIDAIDNRFRRANDARTER
jgi:hypothetical protein